MNKVEAGLSRRRSTKPKVSTFARYTNSYCTGSAPGLDQFSTIRMSFPSLPQSPSPLAVTARGDRSPTAAPSPTAGSPSNPTHDPARGKAASPRSENGHQSCTACKVRPRCGERRCAAVTSRLRPSASAYSSGCPWGCRGWPGHSGRRGQRPPARRAAPLALSPGSSWQGSSSPGSSCAVALACTRPAGSPAAAAARRTARRRTARLPIRATCRPSRRRAGPQTATASNGDTSR